MKKISLAIIIGSFLLVGCAQNSGTHETITVINNQKEDSKRIERVSKTTFSAFLAEHENVQLIDVRTPQEFEQGNIKSATNINFNASDFEERINTLDKKAPVLIYCQSGGRSSRALKVFEANGFTTVLELEGGYSNW